MSLATFTIVFLCLCLSNWRGLNHRGEVLVLRDFVAYIIYQIVT